MLLSPILWKFSIFPPSNPRLLPIRESTVISMGSSSQGKHTHQEIVRLMCLRSKSIGLVRKLEPLDLDS